MNDRHKYGKNIADAKKSDKKKRKKRTEISVEEKQSKTRKWRK